MTQRLKITQMFITPYVVKSLMKGQATEKKKEFDTSSLRIIANGGEPLQTFVLNWFQTRLGKDRCTVIDTWWQTGIKAVKGHAHSHHNASHDSTYINYNFCIL